MITHTVTPKTDKMFAALKQLPQDQPVLMLNLLKFRDQAQYKDGRDGGSGRDAYAQYSEQVLPMLKDIGANVQYSAKVMAHLIAPDEEHWDEVLLVRYPTVAAFMQMITSPEYLQATRHRTAALLDSRLIATME